MELFQPRPGRVMLAVALATFAVFGGLLAGITWQLRGFLRAEVLRREAEAIHAVATMQLRAAEERMGILGGEDAIEEIFAAVLESSRLRGVLAVQLFDAGGALRAALPNRHHGSSAGPGWPGKLSAPEARFDPRGSLEEIFGEAVEPGAEPTRVPLLDIAVPLRRDPDAREHGVARFWVDGGPVRAEFARMDRRLRTQAGVMFLGGTALVALILSWAFSRLSEARRRLEAQRADLVRANEELDFAAKTGALGAISAHLIHGLNNPLAGIEGFVAETAAGAPDAATRGEACRLAIETTRRLRALVNEVATVLRDEAGGPADYAVPVAEVVEAARGRAGPLAAQAGVAVTATAEPDGRMMARTANLAGLVLANLMHNAIEASPRGATIMVEARSGEGSIDFIVRDTGPGLPPGVRAELFRPVRSAKRGGGGVGLAISLRLAKHAGGNLELVRSDARGTEFRLTVPGIRAA